MQEKVREFNNNMPCHKKPMPTWARVADIQSELGELNKEVLKASNYGTKEFELNEEFVMEFGDCLYSLMSLANELLWPKNCFDFLLILWKKLQGNAVFTMPAILINSSKNPKESVPPIFAGSGLIDTCQIVYYQVQ